MRTKKLLITALLISYAPVFAELDPAEHYQKEASRWVGEMQRFHEADEETASVEDAILVIGSSSIRLWESIDEDLAPLPVIKRAFGGAKISDVAVYADQLIAPHDCRAVVFFIGAKDACGKPDDKTPEQLCLLANYLVKKVHEHHGDVPVTFMEITPSPARVHLQNEVGQLNCVLRAVCSASQNVYWLSTREGFLKEGEPRPKLFARDRLHLSPEGYAVWTTLLNRHLEEVL